MKFCVDNQLDEKTEILIRDIKVILELKSVEAILPIHEAQLISYLKSTGLIAGLLINFKEKMVKNGIKRFVQTKSC